ncbi:MAG: hypothetical protein HEEMFOPI_01629 [Holosporales bacterium]
MSVIKKIKIPKEIEKSFEEIFVLLKKICDEKLNQEYFDLCYDVLLKLARKRSSPLLVGKPKTWAAEIVHALGMVNFLFDKSQFPHITSGEISAWFDVS